MSEARVAFVGGDRQIWTLRADGTDPRQMTFGEGAWGSDSLGSDGVSGSQCMALLVT